VVPDRSHDGENPADSPGLRAWLVVYLKGVAMGSADAVPGVSGGTIALITGIYERFIAAVTALDPAVLGYLPGLYRREDRAEFLDSLRRMDIPFLLVLGTGILTAVVLLARVVEEALATVPGPTFAFFFGLIGASAVVLADAEWLRVPEQVGAGLVGFSLAFLIAGASSQGLLASTLPVVFVGGIFAICGMVLPGISGAFILLLLGQYDHMTATLNDFVDGLIDLASAGVTEGLLGDGATIVAFLSGGAVGLFTVAYAVRFALERYRHATLAFLVSLMLGSLRLPVIEMADASDGSPGSLVAIVSTAVAGAAGIFLLDRFTEDLEY
jgi:putative membrane protein